MVGSKQKARSSASGQSAKNTCLIIRESPGKLGAVKAMKIGEDADPDVEATNATIIPIPTDTSQGSEEGWKWNYNYDVDVVDDGTMDEEAFLRFEKEADAVRALKEKVEQEMRDRAYARDLDRNLNRGYTIQNGDQYSLRARTRSDPHHEDAKRMKVSE